MLIENDDDIESDLTKMMNMTTQTRWWMPVMDDAFECDDILTTTINKALNIRNARNLFKQEQVPPKKMVNHVEKFPSKNFNVHFQFW